MFQEFYSGTDLLIWPLVGMGLFLLSFIGVLLYVFFVMRKGRNLDRIASLPLEDDNLINLEKEDAENE